MTMGAWLARRRNRRRAGARARRQYERLRREWLRRNRKLWLVVVAGALAIYGAACALATVIPGDQRWWVGFVAGALVIGIIAVRSSPPTAIGHWEEGAWGEERTAQQLVVLEREGWIVLHDLGNGHGNFDHVVLGPNGIFCLNSKWSTYRLELDERGLLVGRSRFDPDLVLRVDGIVGRVRREAIDLKKIVEARTGVTLWVQAVVVWWGDVENGGRQVGDIGVVRGEDLVARLRGISGRRIPEFDRVVAALAPGRHTRARMVSTSRSEQPQGK